MTDVPSIWENGVVRAATPADLQRPPPTVAELTAFAVSEQDAIMNGGMLYDGFPVDTDETGRGFINGAYNKAQSDPSVTKRWQVGSNPITFLTVTAPQLIGMGHAADALVQGSFDALDTATAGINAGTITTKDQVSAAFASIPRSYTTPAAS